MTMQTALIEKYLQFVNSPVEDHEWRARNPVSNADFSALHVLAVRSSDLWHLYYPVVIAQNADRLYRDNKVEGSIAKIRKVLSRVETRKYESNGETIVEEVRYHYYPVKKVIRRDRIGPNRAIYEVELAFQTWPGQDPIDLDRYWPGVEEELLLSSQRYPDRPDVQSMTFLPGDKNVSYWVIFCWRKLRKKWEAPVVFRYSNLIKSLVTTYRLEPHGVVDVVKDEGRNVRTKKRNRSRFSRADFYDYRTIEITEGMRGLWFAVKEYDPARDKHIPGYVKRRVTWHMAGEFDKASTPQWKDSKVRLPDDERYQKQRILKSAFESQGGSLDAPIDPDDPGSDQLRDLVPSLDSPEAEVVCEEIYQSLDPEERQIVTLRTIGLSGHEIAEELGLSEPGVSKKIKLIQAKVRALLNE